jgi:glycerol-3-phosphate acyltransferase PlsY
LAAGISWYFFRTNGWIVTLYAGLGCTLGHLFPFWRRFRGGKGVATISMAIVIFSFPWGLAANIAGMLTVFVTKYLCIGGPVIPLAFMVAMAALGRKEAALIGLVMFLLSLGAHASSIRGIRSGKTKQINVLAKIFKRML